MLRRPILGELPMSKLAQWSSRLGWFALTVTLLSIVIVRSEILEIEPALATFAAALVFAAFAILLALASFIVIWRDGLRGLGRALTGLWLGLALLAYPAYLGYRASKLPMINDITTDPSNPPRFDTLARLRPRGTNDYPGAKVAALQRKAYPDIQPLQVDVRPPVAYDLVMKLITKRKWHVIDARPPEARHDGVIEAVARTPIMGFRDDVVVRVSADGDGARVDMRSASRFGASDIGANASRIRALLDDVDDAAGSIPEQKTLPPKRPVGKTQPAKR